MRDGLFSPFAKVQMLLGFLGYRAGVEGPGEFLSQVNTKEFGSLDDLYRGAIDVQQRVDALCPSEVNNHLFSQPSAPSGVSVKTISLMFM